MILHSLKLTDSSHPKNGWKPIGISEIPGVYFQVQGGCHWCQAWRNELLAWRSASCFARPLGEGIEAFQAPGAIVYMGVSCVYTVYIYIVYTYYVYIYTHIMYVYIEYIYNIILYIILETRPVAVFFVSVPTPMWHPMVLPWLPWQDIKQQGAGFCVMGFAGRKGATSQLCWLCVLEGWWVSSQNKGI